MNVVYKRGIERTQVNDEDYSLKPRDYLLALVDQMHPEDLAMLQALYSRSPESVAVHLEKVAKAGSGKFMGSYYVGYGHKSIADCGSTTLFLEGVSLLAAKAVQDWPLYSGQETSTRYSDMSKQKIVDPVGTQASREIHDRWMAFYTNYQGNVANTVRSRHPRKEGETEENYEKAVKARTFDIMRGFLPAGITTQLSWHTNLRQAGDHLVLLRHHPTKEVRDISEDLMGLLATQYPTSTGHLPSVAGVKASEGEVERTAWEKDVAERDTYWNPGFLVRGKARTYLGTNIDRNELAKYSRLLETRPRGSILPHFLSELGSVTMESLMDFGSFRDLQRHRNGVCRMPLLTDEWGFHRWYLDQLDADLCVEASNLITHQRRRVAALDVDRHTAQYYHPLGNVVPFRVTYGLPAFLYILELRSGKHIHPTLRKVILEALSDFELQYPYIKLHADKDPDDWTIRRGLQTITEKGADKC